MNLPTHHATTFHVAGVISLLYVLPAGCMSQWAPGASQSDTGPTVYEPPLLFTLGDPATSGLDHWPAPFDAPPKAYDIDGDGTNEIIAHSNDTNVYVFSALTGRALAVLPTTYPSKWFIDRIINGVEAATLRPGEPPSIIVANHAAYVAVWRFLPADSTSAAFAFERVWEKRMDDCFPTPGMDAKPVLADVDGDKEIEILVQTEEVGFYALNADGTVRWKHCWTGGNGPATVADINGDDQPEAIFASDGGFVSVFDASSGAPQWTFSAGDSRYGLSPASVSAAPIVAELDGQPPREILFTARQAPRDVPADFPSFHMAIFAVHQNTTNWNGELLWVRQPTWANPLSYSPLIVEDVNGDGDPEIFGVDWNTIGHKPGNWQRLGPAHAFRLTSGGDDVWVREVDSWWSNKELMLTQAGTRDFSLLVNGAHEASDGLWSFSAKTGKPTAFLPTSPWKVMRGPVQLDLFHDGRSQLAMPVTPDEPSPTQGAILLFDTTGTPF